MVYFRSKTSFFLVVFDESLSRHCCPPEKKNETKNEMKNYQVHTCLVIMNADVLDTNSDNNRIHISFLSSFKNRHFIILGRVTSRPCVSFTAFLRNSKHMVFFYLFSTILSQSKLRSSSICASD